MGGGRKTVSWRGVFPAVSTQFSENGQVDFEAIGRIVRALVADGISGLIACGSVGENTVLSPTEKREVIATIRDAADGRVPVIAGVAEITTEAARTFARDAERVGAHGLMVMPPMIYSAKPAEIVAYFRAVASASSLPIMLYNNPPAYRNDITPDMLKALADVDTIVAVKESSGDTRRLVDIQNAVGDRFMPFCGLDDVILEAVTLGAVGWISGLSNVFPRECNRLFDLAASGRAAEALPLYRWLMPLLHLDARADLVQCIKLCEQIAGRGSERTRPPRLALEGADRTLVEAVMKAALATRPALPEEGRAA
jgi:1-pyrroline-4-hydroxy-2-carboxylate deaminase